MKYQFMVIVTSNEGVTSQIITLDNPHEVATAIANLSRWGESMGGQVNVEIIELF